MIRFAIALFLLSSMASAATLPVQGGEHADFTRLVVPLPDGANWDLQVMGRQAILRIDGADFETSRTFDKIPRDRLVSLTKAGDGALALNLACECTIRRSIVDGHIVIDIATAHKAAIFPIVFDAEPRPLPVPFSLPRRPREPSQIEGDLSVALARATTAGILDAAPVVVPLSAADNLPDGVGVKLLNPTGIELADPAENGCPLHDPYDPNLWGATGDFSADIATARRQISLELDEIDATGVLNLVRLNLFYGFVEEAAQTAKLLPHPDPSVDIIAAAMSGYSSEIDEEICSDFGAFWFAMVDPSIPISEQAERGYSRLPDPLRTHLSGAYLSRLIRSGALSSARTIMSHTTFSEAETASLSALIAEANGDFETAMEHWANLAELTPDDPHAILRVVQISNDLKRPVSPDILTLAKAADYSQRGTDAGRALTPSLAVAEALAGQYRSSLDRLHRIDHQSDAALLAMETFVHDAPDAEFLRLSLTALPPVIAEPSRLLVEARLRDMGFTPEQHPQADDVQMTPLPQVQLEPPSNLASVHLLLARSSETRGEIERTISGNDF